MILTDYQSLKILIQVIQGLCQKTVYEHRTLTQLKTSEIDHQQKKMNEKELREFRDRLNVPISDEEIVDTPFFRPDKKSDEYANEKKQNHR